MTVLTSPDENEYEVWANGCFNPPRVLVVMPAADDRLYRVIDPSRENAPVFTSGDFLQVVAYLSEEDYERVRGRMKFDECGDDEDY